MRNLITGAIVALALAGTAAAEGIPGPWTTRTDEDSVRVYGCKAEDDCKIDYRGDRNGRGVWVIKRVEH